MWLVGGIPQFDNVCYYENVNTGDLLPNNLEREQNLQSIRTMASEEDSNIVTGNRHNLLFVQSALEHIKQTYAQANQGGRQSEIARAISRFECAILGLQIGHYGAVDQILKEMEGESSIMHKSKLWASFRTAATQIRLHNQIDQLVSSQSDTDLLALDQYLTMNSEVLDKADCETLKQQLV
jgi:regulator of sigma D